MIVLSNPPPTAPSTRFSLSRVMYLGNLSPRVLYRLWVGPPRRMTLVAEHTEILATEWRRSPLLPNQIPRSVRTAIDELLRRGIMPTYHDYVTRERLNTRRQPGASFVRPADLRSVRPTILRSRPRVRRPRDRDVFVFAE